MKIQPTHWLRSRVKHAKDWWFLYVLIAFIAALLAWQYEYTRYPSWDEEVRLSDGRVITIHQKREYYENHGTTQSWVTIDLPELGGKRTWHSRLTPQRIDAVEGKVFVFGKPRGPNQLMFYRYPKHYMVAMVWDGHEFQRIPFLQLSASIRSEENVYSCVPYSHRMLTISRKEKEWCPPTGDQKQFTRNIDLDAYTKLANEMAALSNWTHRSD